MAAKKRKKNTKKKKPVARKKTRKKAVHRGPKRTTRKKKISPDFQKRYLPALKLILALSLGYLAYSFMTTDIPDSKTKAKTIEKKVTQASKLVAKKSRKIEKKKATSPVQKVAPKKSVPKKKVTTPKKVAAKPTVLKTTSSPAPIRRITSSKPKLIFVIDDIGHNIKHQTLYSKIGRNVTCAVLPFLNYSQYYSQLCTNLGAEVILHLPLEAQDGTIPGPGLITSQMSQNYVLERVRENLKSVPHHVGANNHMGSFGTTNPQLMETILYEFRRQNMFFLDSYTSASSVILPISEHIGLPVLRRDIFLDNVDNPESIRQQIRNMEGIALRQGHAIGIGHDRHHTLSVILEELPGLKRRGFETVNLQELLDYRSRN